MIMIMIMLCLYSNLISNLYWPSITGSWNFCSPCQHTSRKWFDDPSKCWNSRYLLDLPNSGKIIDGLSHVSGTSMVHTHKDISSLYPFLDQLPLLPIWAFCDMPPIFLAYFSWILWSTSRAETSLQSRGIPQVQGCAFCSQNIFLGDWYHCATFNSRCYLI